MGAPRPPPPPDPVQQQKIAMQGSKEAAQVQGEYNLKALQQSQAASMIGQNTPVGSLSYSQTGKDKYGNPLYTLNAQLSPEQQALYNKQTLGQNIVGASGLGMLASSSPMYSDANTMMSNLFGGADSLTGYRVKQALGFQQPFMQQDVNYLDNQLRNQGIMPDSPAYQRAMADLKKTQYGMQQNFISSVLPQSIGEATSAYMMPLQTGMQESQYGSPAVLSQMSTPQFSAQPANFTQAYGTAMGAQSQNYQNQLAGYNAQMQNYSGMMNGIFGIGSGAMKLFI